MCDYVVYGNGNIHIRTGTFRMTHNCSTNTNQQRGELLLIRVSAAPRGSQSGRIITIR